VENSNCIAINDRRLFNQSDGILIIGHYKFYFCGWRFPLPRLRIREHFYRALMNDIVPCWRRLYSIRPTQLLRQRRWFCNDQRTGRLSTVAGQKRSVVQQILWLEKRLWSDTSDSWRLVRPVQKTERSGARKTDQMVVRWCTTMFVGVVLPKLHVILILRQAIIHLRSKLNCLINWRNIYLMSY
jgi:hypothetical protein